MKEQEPTRSIRISQKTWRKLMKLKLYLNVRSIDEIIDRMLKIVDVQEMKK